MAIFNCYVSSPEGTPSLGHLHIVTLSQTCHGPSPRKAADATGWILKWIQGPGFMVKQNHGQLINAY